MPKMIPFGDRILVRRRIVGEKIGKEKLIYAPDKTKEAKTDLADIVSVPEHTFSDGYILERSDEIVKALTEEAIKGNSEALIGLLRINEFVKLKSLQPGDVVLISKYTGTDFHDDNPENEMTLVREEDIIGLVVEDGK